MKEQEKKIQEMQYLEQNLQNLLVQKQAFQLELIETQSALKELESAGEEDFKIIGQLMLKTSKEKTKEGLSNKEKLLSLRIKSIEKQENLFREQLEKIRDEILEKKDKK